MQRQVLQAACRPDDRDAPRGLRISFQTRMCAATHGTTRASGTNRTAIAIADRLDGLRAQRFVGSRAVSLARVVAHGNGASPGDRSLHVCRHSTLRDAAHACRARRTPCGVTVARARRSPSRLARCRPTRPDILKETT
ncbi:hypothetical protein [Burkholderia multivorans]|uniref:hypothetical protein n=1 Tax=Burkholderia multivorans TaxID=87883 RepID=UPI000D00EA33|nr:hypothetical protein [Burkholderia multivorans]MBR7893642.1 hypothetical protein [Burkholderia multivorans]MBR8455427.1 hypothetical protein [Burkholderia multivorans]MBU9451901.1 hypothetical protein [Burkholderia multivorans]MCL4645888.1 hypothetical protein [Burkholderia multivorans]PRG30217.1 hypothetical protein C6T68_29095 [Burkholderia multivorans]